MRLFQISLLLLSLSSAFGQEDKSHKTGISLSVNSVGVYPYKEHGALFTDGMVNYNHGVEKDKSFCLGFGVNHMLSSEFGFRIKATLSKRDLTTSYGSAYIDSSNLSVQEFSGLYTFKQDDWGVFSGFFYQYRKNKIVVFGGFDLEYINHGKAQISDVTTSINGYNYYREFPKGFSIGTGPFAGVNYFPIKKVSIGGELSFALLYTKFAGLYHNRRINNFTSNIDVDMFINDRFTRTQMTSPRCALNISVWF